jgi:hypothetical protein
MIYYTKYVRAEDAEYLPSWFNILNAILVSKFQSICLELDNINEVIT